MKKIKYIVRKRALGDALWIEPVIRQLAEKVDSLIVHTKFNILFENYPLKNVRFKEELSFFEKCLVHSERIIGSNFFSYNLDNEYEKYPRVHFLHAYQKRVGLPLTTEYPKIYLSEKEKNTRAIQEKYVVLHLESFSPKIYREVVGINWNDIVDFFRQQGYLVIHLGLKDKQLENTTRIKTSLRELMSLIYHADYFIGVDSGPSHIAASLQVPSLILFGAINPELRHFPTIFKGALAKNICAKACDNDGITELKEHHCKLADSSGIPKCCIFTTSFILTEIKKLVTTNDSKASQ